MKLGGCKVGGAKVTRGYKLQCKYIIHTVGPKWRGGKKGEREQLISCYRESIRLAIEYGCINIAFPLISAGVYGYPIEEAIKLAIEIIETETKDKNIEAILVLFGKEAKQVVEVLLS